MVTKINLLNNSCSLHCINTSHPINPSQDVGTEEGRDSKTCLCRAGLTREGEGYINSEHCEIHKHEGGNQYV